MKKENTTAAAMTANEKRLASMRAGLEEKEQRAAALLEKGDSMTAAERLQLLELVNVAYHDSGKIEGCWSIDSCAACDFCQAMITAARENILIICGSCYAAADAWKEAAWRRHKLNARILSQVLFTREELASLALGPRCRINEDGDTVNGTHAQNILRIIETHPATRFGYWYKNRPAVAAGLAAEGIRTRDQLPANVRFIHSSVLIGIPAAATWFDDGIFTVFPDDTTTAAAVAAGAWECNGRRCRACGYECYLGQRRPAPVHIAEVLRCNKARRAAILAALARYQAQQAIIAG